MQASQGSETFAVIHAQSIANGVQRSEAVEVLNQRVKGQGQSADFFEVVEFVEGRERRVPAQPDPRSDLDQIAQTLKSGEVVSARDREGLQVRDTRERSD